jgi:hypothetical protein
MFSVDDNSSVHFVSGVLGRNRVFMNLSKFILLMKESIYVFFLPAHRPIFQKHIMSYAYQNSKPGFVTHYYIFLHIIL